MIKYRAKHHLSDTTTIHPNKKHVMRKYRMSLYMVNKYIKNPMNPIISIIRINFNDEHIYNDATEDEDEKKDTIEKIKDANDL